MKQVKQPQIYPREKWGAKSPDCSRMKKHTLRFITLHHSGVAYHSDPAPPIRIKKLQEFSFNEKNWPDIPYHFKIDLQGRIWEARSLEFAGETNTSYDPTGHALICVMGNFEEQSVTPEQLDSVVQLCAWLCSQYNIPPERIKGHKDYAETLCPGRDFYPYISSGNIKRRVEEILSDSE